MAKFQEIKAIFESVSNPDQAVQMSKYMRNLFPFYGIPSPLRKTIGNDVIKTEKKLKIIDWVLLDECWDDPHREMQYFVQDYLGSMKKYLTYDDVPRIEKYIRSKQWWDTIDFLDKIVGNIAFSDSRINELMLTWSKDENFWLRRLAIDHQNGRKEKTDTVLLETIISNNLGSDEFFINKAIGWSLRDYSKVNPEWVRNFIDRYRNRLDKLSIREGSKYI